MRAGDQRISLVVECVLEGFPERGGAVAANDPFGVEGGGVEACPIVRASEICGVGFEGGDGFRCGFVYRVALGVWG